MRTNGQLSIGFLVTTALSIVTGLAYWFASSQVNWRPPVKKFDGWIAVLEPANANWGGQVNLTMTIETAGLPGRPPGVAYAVAVCGTAPFRGELLIGGDARLSAPKAVEVATDRPVELESLPRLTVADQTGSRPLDSRGVQRVRLAIAKPPPCLWNYTSGRPLPPFQKGGAIRVRGNTQAQVRHQASGIADWEGPRSTQLWPLVGAFPSVPSDFATLLPVTVQGLRGEWLRPPQSYFTTVAGPLDSTAVLANARPDPAGTQPLSWRDVQPIRASAEIEDSSVMGWWQQAMVVASLVFGVCISLWSGFALGFVAQRHRVAGCRRPRDAAGATDAASRSNRPAPSPARPTASSTRPVSRPRRPVSSPDRLVSSPRRLALALRRPASARRPLPSPGRLVPSPGRLVSPPGRLVSPPCRPASALRQLASALRQLAWSARRLVLTPGRPVSPGRLASPPDRLVSPSGRLVSSSGGAASSRRQVGFLIAYLVLVIAFVARWWRSRR